jgi:hypothetical protein
LEILIQENEGSFDWHVRQGLDVVVKPMSTSNCAYAEWPQFRMNQASIFPTGGVVTPVAPLCRREVRLISLGKRSTLLFIMSDARLGRLVRLRLARSIPDEIPHIPDRARHP